MKAASDLHLRVLTPVFAVGLLASSTTAIATPVIFTFEAAGIGSATTSPEIIYGSQDTSGPYPALVRNGFVIDVAPTAATGSSVHWHEIDSVINYLSKVPARPVAERGVLWRDSIAGQDPLVFTPTTPKSLFSLNSLVVGGSIADGSQTTSVQVQAFRSGNLLTTATLSTPLNGYASYGTSSLGNLPNVAMDRLEFIGQSSSSSSYYMLDNVELNTILFADVVRDAVHPNLTNYVAGSPKTMELVFKPNFGLTLQEAAALGGYDHFNWISIIRSAPEGGPYPVMDGIGSAPNGTRDYGLDNAPYYWEEHPGSGTDARYVIGNTRNTPDIFTLSFEDTPHGNPFTYDGSVPFDFVTSLVGVKNAIDWDILNSWTWKSNNNGSGGGVFDPIHFGTIDPVPWENGGIFDVHNRLLDDLPADVRQIAIAYGVSNIPDQTVPEPATILLFGAGIGGLWAVRRSRVASVGP